MGAASPPFSRAHLRMAYRLGIAIAQRDCALITGACPGLPLAAGDGAKATGGMVIGISPALSPDEDVRTYGSPVEGHDALIFTGSGLMGREVVNIRSADSIVIVGGRSGTVDELAIAYDKGKLIGVLVGSGGITGIVPDIIAACRTRTGVRLLYDAEPDRLMDRLIHEYQTRHFRRPSCHMADAKPVWNGGRTARDPVCGMWIDPRHAPAHVTAAERRRHFCSAGCMRAFRAAPRRFIDRLMLREWPSPTRRVAGTARIPGTGSLSRGRPVSGRHQMCRHNGMMATVDARVRMRDAAFGGPRSSSRLRREKQRACGALLPQQPDTCPRSTSRA